MHGFQLTGIDATFRLLGRFNIAFRAIIIILSRQFQKWRSGWPFVPGDIETHTSGSGSLY
jgi:hypothetical protein